MSRPSNNDRILFVRRGLLLAVTIIAFHQRAWSQERTLTVNASVGYKLLQMKDVDGDNQRDVEAWNDQGIPIGPFPPLKATLSLSISVSYRFNRDNAVSLSIATMSRQVVTSYNGPDATLDMKRSVGSTDITIGVVQYFRPLLYSVDWYAGVEVGLMFARADAEAFGTRTFTVSDSTETLTFLDTKAAYRATKIIVNFNLGAQVQVFEPMMVKLDVSYKFGGVGKMDGDVSRIGSTTHETTSIGFDYSGFVFNVGLGVVF